MPLCWKGQSWVKAQVASSDTLALPQLLPLPAGTCWPQTGQLSGAGQQALYRGVNVDEDDNEVQYGAHNAQHGKNPFLSVFHGLWQQWGG